MYQKKYNLENHSFAFKNKGESTLEEIISLVVDGKIADLAYWMDGVNNGKEDFLIAQTGSEYGKKNKKYTYEYKEFFPEMLTMCFVRGKKDVLEFLLFDDVNLSKEELIYPKLWEDSAIVLDGMNCLQSKEQQECAELALINKVYWDIADCHDIPYDVWSNVFEALKDDRQKLKELEQAFFVSVDCSNVHVDYLKENNPEVYGQYLRYKDLLMRLDLKEEFQKDKSNEITKKKQIKKM